MCDALDHCKKHGADVTARVMAMIHHAGLMHLPLSPGQRGTRSVGLLAMVAAMIHDYGTHPHTLVLYNEIRFAVTK